MAKLVFDIETLAQPLDHFDDIQQEYLFREANRIADPLASAARRVEIEKMLSLWPLTSSVLCIAMVNADTGRGQVLYTADDFDPEAIHDDAEVAFVPCVDERELLATFWDVAQHYDTAITFNGRGFDVPFLYLRSAVLQVPITKKNWLGYRYQVDPHCDLAEQFTFYNVSGREGAARKFNLDFYCKVFAIESPKAQGVDGTCMAEMVAAGRYREIAEYCLRDVVATTQLYHIWKDRLGGIK